MASVQDLMKKKDEIELEIDAQVKILEGNSMVGMDGPLVDREGFPRDDIDVYQVREARNKIICLGNDHKALMKQIEAQLYSIHAEAKDNGTTRIPIIGDTSTDPPRTFAHITMVTEGSPSHNAGLRVGDRVIEFGSIGVDNFNGLNDISGVVQHSVGRSVRVVVWRDGKKTACNLIPRQWNGRGLLGCVIAPLDT